MKTIALALLLSQGPIAVSSDSLPPDEVAEVLWAYPGGIRTMVVMPIERAKELDADLLNCRGDLAQATAEANVPLPAWLWIGTGVLLGGAVGATAGVLYTRHR